MSFLDFMAIPGGSTKERYQKLMRQKQEEMMADALKQAELNEALMKSRTVIENANPDSSLQALAGGSSIAGGDVSGMIAKHNDVMLRRTKGAAGTAEMLQKIAQGGEVEFRGAKPGEMYGRVNSKEKSAAGRVKKLENDEMNAALDDLEKKKKEMGKNGFARFVMDNPAYNPVNW